MRSRLSADTSTPSAAAASPASARTLALTWADGAALLAVVFWGLNFSVTKDLMAQAPPLAVTFVRAALSSCVFAAVLAVAGQWRLPKRRDLGRLLLAGWFGMALNTVLWSLGLHLTSASHSGLIFTLTPLLVFGISHALGYLRLGQRDLLGLALGVVGAALIVGVPALSGTESGGATLLGDLLTVGAAMTWGIWMLLATPLLRRYGTLPATAWINMVGTIGLFPLALPELVAHDWTRLTWHMVGGFLYAATLSGALGGLLWYGAVRRLGAARTTIYANMESFFAVLFAALLLGERVEWTALVGGLAVIGGVLLTRRAPSS